MLDTLEREYRTIEDIHEKLKVYTDDETQKILVDRLEQLDENKHSFLRVRTERLTLSLPIQHALSTGVYSGSSKIGSFP
jgi:hypothetical protein